MSTAEAPTWTWDGPYPRTAWTAEEPARPVEERLAVAALAIRAAAMPPACIDCGWGGIVGWPDGPADERAYRAALLEAACLVAEAPWVVPGPGAAQRVVVVDLDGVDHVHPHPRFPLDGPIPAVLCLAAQAGLTDEPINVNRLPLLLALADDGCDGALELDPWAFAFIGTTDTAGGGRLWLYRRAGTRRTLALDAMSVPWRRSAEDRCWLPCGDRAAAFRSVATGMRRWAVRREGRRRA